MLTDAKVKAARPQEKDYKLADSGQLYLLVTKAGGRLWRMNYTYGRNAKGNPIQKTLALGSYPAVTLVEARRQRDQAKALLVSGVDPAVAKKEAAAEKAVATINTFKAVARRWFALKSGWDMDKFDAWVKEHDGEWSWNDAANWTARAHGKWAVRHADKVWRSLVENVFDEIGALPITSIKAPQLLEFLKAIEARDAIETAHRVRQRLSAVFVYGIAAGVCDTDPAASLGKALLPKPRSRRQPALTDLDSVRKILADCEALRSRAVTKFALRLLALTHVRSSELSGGEWSEIEGIDFETGEADNPLWRVPAERMKGDEARKNEEEGDHLVPLSTQAVDALLALHQLTGDLRLMFPNERHAHKPISENTIRQMLIRAGYYQRHVPHGWRSAFSTIMNERADREWREKGGRGDAPDRAIIDLMLAHVPKDKVETAYNRASYMPRRRELAQEWADMLMEGLPPAAEHIGKPMRRSIGNPGNRGNTRGRKKAA